MYKVEMLQKALLNKPELLSLLFTLLCGSIIIYKRQYDHTYRYATSYPGKLNSNSSVSLAKSSVERNYIIRIASRRAPSPAPYKWKFETKTEGPPHERLQRSIASGRISALNPKSPFYGVPFKDAYGLPLSDYGINEPFRQSKEQWEDFFPAQEKGFKKYRAQNPSKAVYSSTTYLRFFLQSEQYSFGDELKATVIAYDGLARAKTFGGDYIQARLYRTSRFKPKDGAACRVEDHNDGTYTVTAPLVHTGEINLEINLMISVEALFEINEVQEKLRTWKKANCNATLVTGEEVECDADLQEAETYDDRPLCDYSNPRNKEPWFCVKPPSGVCSPINFTIRSTSDSWKHHLGEVICDKYTCNDRTTQMFKVSESPINSLEDFKSSLPLCNTLFSLGVSFFSVRGFFNDGAWISLHCKPAHEKYPLKNKVIYFLGDSTMRQFYEMFVSDYNLESVELYAQNVLNQPRVAYSKPASYNSNVTLYYRAHGPPLNDGGTPETQIPISDSIVGVPAGGTGVYVIFNIGSNFLSYDPSLFINRANGIKKAIIQHHRKFPDTRFLVKGLNFVKTRNLFWNMYRFEMILRKIFKDMKNVLLLNFWDVTTVWPQNEMNPNRFCLDIEVQIMLDYIV